MDHGPIRAVYYHTDGGIPENIYIKTSGTSNTGWTAVTYATIIYARLFAAIVGYLLWLARDQNTAHRKEVAALHLSHREEVAALSRARMEETADLLQRDPGA